MKRLIRYLEDCLLMFLQGRCNHPGEMVAVDVLDGASHNYAVKDCRRCGAVKVDYLIGGEPEWRLPNPHLWR